MTLVFALLTALVASGAVVGVLHPLRRYARRSAAAGAASAGGAPGRLQTSPADAALLDEIEREIRAIRARGEDARRGVPQRGVPQRGAPQRGAPQRRVPGGAR